MSKPNDISNLFGEIGADASGYRDLAADNQVNASLGRWPLLATVHGHRPETAGPAPDAAPQAAPEPPGAESVPAPELKTTQHVVSAPAPAPVSSLFKTMSQPTGSVPASAPVPSLFKSLSEPAARAPAAAPVAGLFRRMSQPAPAPRQEPVLNAFTPAPSPAPGNASSGDNLQGLFARLEGQPDAQPQPASSVSLFQRLIRK